MHLVKAQSFIKIFIFMAIFGCSTSEDLLTITPKLTVCDDCPKLNPRKPEQYLSAMKLRIEKESDEYLKSYMLRDIFLKAVEYESSLGYEQSEKFYELVYNFNKQDEFILKKLAQGYSRTGKLKRAKAYIQENLDLNKELSSTGIQLAMILSNIYEGDSQIDKSINTYKQILSSNPQVADACIRLAELYTQVGKIENGVNTLKSCRKSLKQDYIKAEIDFKLGRYYLDLNNLSESEKYFKKAYKTSPRNSKSLAALAVILEETGRKSNYIKMFKNHLERFPDDYLILSRLLDHSIINEDYLASIKYLEQMSDLNSKETDLKFKLTYLYRQVGSTDKAIETLKEVIAEDKEVGKSYYFLADLYFQKGDNVRGFASLESIPYLSSYYADGSMKLANKYREKALKVDNGGRFIASFQDTQSDQSKYSKFIEKRIKGKKNPKLVFDLTIHKVSYLDKLKKYKEAAKLLSTVSENVNFDDKFSFYLASLYEKNKDFKKLDKLILSMIEDDPLSAEAHNFIGYSYLERDGKIDQAKHHIEKANEIKPNDPHILDSLGWLRFKQGNHKLAIEILSKANELMEGDATVFKHLGEVYVSLGKHHEGRQYFIEALKISKSEDMTSELKKHLSRLPASK